MERARRSRPVSKGSAAAWLAGALLVACATPAVRPNAGASVKEYAANLSQQRFGLSMKPASDSPLRLATGLAWILEPVYQFCLNAGGQIRVTQEGWIDDAHVPTELDCIRDGRVLWAFDPGYFNGKVNLPGPGGRLFVTFSPSVHSESEVADRRMSEAAAKMEELRAAEAKRQKDRAETARQAELARVAQAEADRRAAQFQNSLKSGDRFQWWVPPGHYVNAVGIVIRLEGELAFVQFENLKMSGQTTRYVRRNELRPIEGTVPPARYEID